MAANTNFRGVFSFGKRFGTHFITQSPPTCSISAAPAFRRSLHASVYDKNIDDLPDYVVHPHSEKYYWSPNPNTGVFRPQSEHNTGVFNASSTTNGGADSVLDQKAVFRSVQELDEPHPSNLSV
ncbi:late embryogenesis abundant protein At5g17165-like isoform X1 [Amaranthus tricolor]|uniref:late embryogenesis abundant protein At5g17165-like isoform X1 n=1 Tax=Amaranthus tricolor TaxID=29722 RepID=UPI00258A43E4|nr:late embryogenesis abundant protein At5g17165-like isoform X1 [Amaranthus tricolor]